MNLELKPYSISVWKDVLKTGTIVVNEEEVQKEYYDEEMVGLIGANDMESPFKIFEPVLTLKTDGSTDLNFNIFGKVYSNEENKLINNPFFSLLKNETKIKLFYNDNWYDFIIKTINRSTTNYQYSIIAKNAYINELSKTGFGVTLQTDLGNNSGTIIELSEKMVEGTDWSIDNSVNLVEKQESPLFTIPLVNNITAINMLREFNSEPTIDINSNSIIYGFYDDINNENPTLQFLYNTNYLIDDKRIITNTDNYILNVAYEDEINEDAIYRICYIIINDEKIKIFNKTNLQINYQYRGKKIIKRQLTQYNDVLERFVDVYEIAENERVIYGYKDYDYITSSTVQNYVTNNKEFTSIDGWESDKNSFVETYLYPEYSADNINEFKSWLESEKTQYLKIYLPDNNSYVYNTGIYDNRHNINCFTEDEEYTIRIKYQYGLAPEGNINNIKIKIASYELQNGIYTLVNEYFNFENLELENNYYTKTAKCLLDAQKTNLYNIGLFISINNAIVDNYLFIEDIQFFQHITDINNDKIYPDSIPNAEVKIKYNYFIIDNDKVGEDSIIYTYIGYEPKNNYIPVYDSNYNKIRTIEVKESNTFNNIQSLCELFECWCDFRVKHDDNGRISLDNNFNAEKIITFKNYIGIENFAGFKYGINLKEIKRDDVSDEIVTKLIVKENTNSIANNGFCTIARAHSNISKESFILNFNYYINQGFLDYTTVMNDLYGTADGHLAYLVNLGKYNNQYDIISQENASLEASLIELEAKQTTYSTLVLSGEQDLLTYKKELKQFCGYSYEDFLNSTDYTELLKETGAESYLVKIGNIQKQVDGYNILLLSIEAQIAQIYTTLQTNEEILETIIENKKELNLKFYVKYSKYIQEGSWNDSNYFDDELYYLDGEQTLNNSAFPKVTYTLSADTISSLPDYSLYNFNIGDITFIEDTEFFGYIYKDGIKTPYHEQVIISEIKLNLDDPSKTTYTIKNYSNNYEDLFQKLTATTQSLQYASGAYGRAASIIDNNGLISGNILQNSILSNSIDLVNSKNNSVIWDENGITVSNINETGDSKKLVRITSGGIYLSKNNGNTWMLGISADGLNTSKLIGGSIDVSKINIINGNIPTFRWDDTGLNAYSYTIDNNEMIYNPNKFVRFDQYGLYGYYGNQNIFKPTSESDIKDNASFGVTWNGFFIKSGDGYGRIEITNENQISVIKAFNGEDGEREVEVVKLGKITEDINSNEYGFLINDNNGQIVLKTTQSGNLSLLGSLFIGGLDESNSKIAIGNFPDEQEFSKVFYSKKDNNYTFIIREDGSVEMSGSLNAPTGSIGGFIIEENSLHSSDNLVTLTPNSIIFKNLNNQEIFKYIDGSLNLKGSIDILGNSTITGNLLVYDNEKNNYIIINGSNGSISSSNYINDNTTGFNLDAKTGAIIANNITIGKSATISDYLELKKTNNLSAGYIISPNYFLNKYSYKTEDSIKMNDAFLSAGTIENNSYIPNFVIKSNGEAYFKKIIIEDGYNNTDNLIKGNLAVEGSIRVINQQENEKGILITSDQGGLIQSNNYDGSSNGWKIDSQGDAYFHNAVIRGTLESAIFQYNKLACVGGKLFISPSVQTIHDIGVENDEDELYYIYNLTNEINILGNNAIELWKTVIECSVDIKGTSIDNCNIYSELISNVDTIKLKILKSSISSNLIDPLDNCLPKGTIIVSTTLTTNLIELNSQDLYGPRISMSSGGGRVIIGNLVNISSDNFTAGIINGYGLYGENVFLEGKLYLPNAGITDENLFYSGDNIVTTEPNEAVRIWAGADAANRHNAPFVVTQDGSLYATKGIFSGEIKGSVIEASKIIGGFNSNINKVGEGLAVCGGLDTSINFYTQKDNRIINNNEITYYEPTITINAIEFIGKDIEFNIKNAQDESIFNIDKEDKITTIRDSIQIEKSDILYSKLYFDSNNSFNLSYNENSIIKINNSISEFSNKISSHLNQIKNKLSYGTNENIYTLVATEDDNEIGYDLFII